MNRYALIQDTLNTAIITVGPVNACVNRASYQYIVLSFHVAMKIAVSQSQQTRPRYVRMMPRRSRHTTLIASDRKPECTFSISKPSIEVFPPASTVTPVLVIMSALRNGDHTNIERHVDGKMLTRSFVKHPYRCAPFLLRGKKEWTIILYVCVIR